MGANTKKQQKITAYVIAAIVISVAGTAFYNEYFSQAQTEQANTLVHQPAPVSVSRMSTLAELGKMQVPATLYPEKTPSQMIIGDNAQGQAATVHSIYNRHPVHIATQSTEETHAKSATEDLSVDDLNEKDDEVDQIDDVSDMTDEQTLPEDARNALNTLLSATEKARHINEQFVHTVERGDTFDKILDESGVDDNVGYRLIKMYPELRNLHPGEKFYWTLNNNGKVATLNWILSRKEERVYTRQPDNKFTRQIIKKKAVWKNAVIRGSVNGSFIQSLLAQGISHSEATQITNALQWQINMRRLHKGDKFALEMSREYLDNKPTGNGDVHAIHLRSGNTDYYAIQAANGRFYDEDGHSTGRGFLRYPLAKRARISSPFNPRRRHPITGLIRPHKGVDFAVSYVPVLAPAEGTVVKVANQRNGAGRYIVIRHSRKYETVYMHLSRVLVHAGQKVKRGQKIAITGNTGRSTGPHLHYEFHINGRPVNPMTVKLPTVANTMSKKELKAFMVRSKEVQKMLAIQ